MRRLSKAVLKKGWLQQQKKSKKHKKAPKKVTKHTTERTDEWEEEKKQLPSPAQRNGKRRNKGKLINIFIWHVLVVFIFLAQYGAFIPFETELKCKIEKKYS